MRINEVTMRGHALIRLYIEAKEASKVFGEAVHGVMLFNAMPTIQGQVAA